MFPLYNCVQKVKVLVVFLKFWRFFDTVASLQSDFGCVAGAVQGGRRVAAGRSSPFTEQIQRHPAMNADTCPRPIDALLHFAMPAVAAFHSVGGAGQQFVVQEGQSLLHGWREETLKGFANGLELSHSAAESGQLDQGRFNTASTVEQGVDLIHDLPQGSKLGIAAGHASQAAFLVAVQMMDDEQMTVIEQIADALPSASGTDKDWAFGL